jgi:hypothetical protein
LIIDSIPYTLYIQNDASASDSVELTFKWYINFSFIGEINYGSFDAW